MDYIYPVNLLKLTLFFFFLSLSQISTAQDKNSFDRVVTLNTPYFVDFADLNGDNIVDMVGVNGNANANIQIYHGKADGSFELKTTLTGSGEYYAVFLQHLNGDGIPDIVAMSFVSGTFFLSSPSGYTSATVPGSGLFNPEAMLFEDFNNDDKLDLFVKNEVFLGDGNGSFTSKDFISGNGGSVAADFNNDDILDLVMTNPGAGTIGFYPGNGDGTFQSALTKTAVVQDAVAKDLNQDGFMDIIAKGYNGEIITFYNDATFSFPQNSTLQLNHNFYTTLNVFDIDLDGTDDLVTSNDNNIRYRPVLANGTYGSEKEINVGMGTLRALVVKDAIGDPFPDIIVMNGFGVTKIYSDKLNAVVQFKTTEKAYDALPFSTFYQINVTVADVQVSYTGLSTFPKDAGTYEVTASIRDANYEGELKGNLTISKKTLTVDVVDALITEGSLIPTFVLTYSGFAGVENSLVLAQLPVASTTATSSSSLGDYVITISGGVDENYVFDYKTGVLTIGVVTGIPEDLTIDVFPNPAVEKIRINSPQWNTVKIYDLSGRNVITRTYSDEDISLMNCQAGVYILQVQFKDGNTLERRIRVN